MVSDQEPGRSAGRPWRGVPSEERRARRREQLIDAAFALMATEGAAAVTMRGVCREARLTERYFYESFSGRDDLLVAVLATVVNRARDVLVRALAEGPSAPVELMRYVVREFTGFVTADPRRGRVLLVESLAAPELANAGLAMFGEFVSTIAGALRDSGLGEPGADSGDIALNARAVFGAMTHLYQSWLAGETAIPEERFVDHVTDVIVRVARASSAPDVD